MGLLEFLRDLYTLNTLDTRFTISSTTPPRDAHRELRSNVLPNAQRDAQNGPDGSSKKAPSRSREPQPSKWNTPEYYLYYLVFIVAIPMMFKAVYNVSQPSHPNFPHFEHLLSEGWIPGRKVDNSDAQYSSFRGNVPYMFAVVLLHPTLRKLYDYLCRADSYTKVRGSSRGNDHLTQGLPALAAADARLEQRVSFDVVFALIFLVVLHGFSVFKILLILYINFKIAKGLPRASVPLATWVFNVGILFANELSRGYSYSTMMSIILPSTTSPDQADQPETRGKWLDSHGGLISRWEVLFKCTVLRLISFNMDYYWSLNMRGASPIEKQLDPSNLSERDRVSTPAKANDYSFRNYFAYAVYSPLYLAGPVLTFNDFISQLRYPLPSIQGSRTFKYAIRFVVVLLTMEVMIHFLYMVAIFHAKPAWENYTPFELSMLGYFNLNHIWLKLLIPWRFFRLWSLIDGIDPPENMVRCMSDNYSALAFWRGWHRSFNRWCVRYIYIPLGGSGSRGLWGKARSVGNFLAVFTFVAIWHDIQLRLLMWGWLITLFVLPEIIAAISFPARKWQQQPTTYRMLCGIGATGNILMMMAANLVGFAIGIDGLQGLVNGIVGSYSGLSFLATACSCLFVGAQVMFEVREQELREGISMKC